MSKGTPSFGKHHKTTHIMCRRCGTRSYHVNKKRCASCGFGATAKWKNPGWRKRRTYPRVAPR